MTFSHAVHSRRSHPMSMPCRTQSRRALSRVSNALVAISSLALIGCDVDSDREIRAQLGQAIDLRAVHSKEADQQAQEKLKGIKEGDSTAPALRAQLASMRGQMHIDLAQQLMRDIDRQEMNLSRVAFDLE